MTLSLVMLLVIAASYALRADSYRVVHVYPHDPSAFTQGLVFLNGLLYESTGLQGQSSLRSVDLKTGKVLQRVNLPKQYFGECLADWQNTLIQITWTSHLGFVYDRFSFRLLRTFRVDGEGWGLTQDGHALILSDGTSTLRFLDPRTFQEVRRIHMTEHGTAVGNLNELEYAHDQIYANIWHSDRVVRISPRSGRVLGSLDLGALMPAGQRSNPEAVLNGIAYNPADSHFFVTGKLWPELFEIELAP